MAKKQLEIPGTEQEVIEEIEQAAESYVSIRDKRMLLTEKEVAAKEVLSQAMHSHNLTSYSYDDMMVTVEAKEKVRVKRIQDVSDDDDE